MLAGHAAQTGSSNPIRLGEYSVRFRSVIKRAANVDLVVQDVTESSTIHTPPRVGFLIR